MAHQPPPCVWIRSQRSGQFDDSERGLDGAIRSPKFNGAYRALYSEDGAARTRTGLIWSGDGLFAGEGWVESPAHADRLRAVLKREIEQKLNKGTKL